MSIAVAGRPALKPWAALAAAVAAMLGGGPEAAARRPGEFPVQLAWRDDPRPSADVPAGVAPSPERRPSRRALRRSVRRAPPGDDARAGAAPLPSRSPTAEPPAAIPSETTADAAAAGVAAEAGGAISHRDQPYSPAGHARQRFDIHLPAACAGEGLPLIVWIHGDDWASGSKADCPVTWLVNHGYAVASVGYRTSAEAAFPAQLDDCRAGLEAILRDAELWGVDRRRTCVAGRGAGGHLAALVGFSPAADADDETTVPDVAAVCAIAAPAHLTSLGGEHDRGSSPASRLVGGPLPEFREAALAASPLVHVSPDDPPTLVLHGTADDVVPVDQARLLSRTLEAAGVDTAAVMLAAGHRIPLGADSPAGRELLAFLGRVLGPGPRQGETADDTPAP